MKIAILGYGKMGVMIEQIALNKGHEIVCKLGSLSAESEWSKLATADVAIEFSNPISAFKNISKCFDANVPVVVGTTGWYDKYEAVKLRCINKNQAIITATNFSIGVNLFFHVNKIIARVMENLPEYDVKIEEIHHTHKLDSPSGTAITIAEGVLSEMTRKKEWKLAADVTSEADLLINSIRTDEVPGTHTITYSSKIDDIEVKHTAHSRTGFATGAVLAAEWLQNKRGAFTMNDFIGF